MKRIPQPPYTRVVLPFVATMAVFVLLSAAGLYLLSAVRAYVGGESLWSKARAEAVMHLGHFVATGDRASHARFIAALAVPLGDRRAREAMDRTPADLDEAHRGFVDGGNDPRDVPGMILLYRGFARSSLMRDSVAAWVEGDRQIAQLRQLGDDAAAGRPVTPAQIEQVATRLVAQEKRFSASLGVASRATFVLLTVSVAALGVVLVFMGSWLAVRGLARYAASQRQLEKANRRWTLASAGDGLGLFEWHVTSGRVTMDARACELYGIEAGPEGRVLQPSEFVSQLGPELGRDIVRRADDPAPAAEVYRQRFAVRRPDGSVVQVEASGVFEGEPRTPRRRLLGILRDVSAEVARAALEVDKAASERLERARIEFLSRLSHELRTPLNAVLGFSQVLMSSNGKASGPTPPRQAEYVRYIHDAGQHLLRLVDDVLDLTRIDAGKFAIELRPVPLAPVILRALRLVETQRAAAEVRVDNRLADDPVEVVADPQRLEQAFANLFSNACKYNRRGGVLTIDGGGHGASVSVAVRDTGRGLDADQIGQLFKPFSRLATAQGIEGTGLGLVITKLLVEQMDGALTVASTPGEGTSFCIELPRASTAAPGTDA